MQPTFDSIDLDDWAASRPGADLMMHPLWRAEDLGKPIPNSRHAASVAMPLWEHVVRYEQKDPALLESLQSGYPRFVFNRYVNDLCRDCRLRFARTDELCVAFPSRNVAEQCVRYLRDIAQCPSRVEDFGLNDIHAVVFPSEAFDTAKQFWQHYGNIVSSRLAEATLDGRQGTYDATPAKEALLHRIGALIGAPGSAVRLYPSGMAALAGALACVRARRPGAKTIQIGLPYVDMLRIQTKWGPQATFYAALSAETFEAIAWQIENETVAGVFCEFPGNPLLRSFDIERLSDLLRTHHIPLIVDETLGSFVNVDVLPFADLVVTSLTKYFSGLGDVMAGSVVVSPSSPLRDELSNHLNALYEDLFWEDDAAALEQNSRDFVERMRRVNANAELVCDYLHGHPRTLHVHYPKFETPELYAKARRAGSGFGGMFSLVLKDAPVTGPKLYDALRVSKGPSLGTNYTLACPYAQLAHFDEPDWIESLGVSPYLVRVSTGLEDAGDLIQRFDEAFAVL